MRFNLPDSWALTEKLLPGAVNAPLRHLVSNIVQGIMTDRYLEIDIYLHLARIIKVNTATKLAIIEITDCLYNELDSQDGDLAELEQSKDWEWTI